MLRKKKKKKKKKVEWPYCQFARQVVKALV
jgi:hypothetical protein